MAELDALLRCRTILPGDAVTGELLPHATINILLNLLIGDAAFHGPSIVLLEIDLPASEG